MSNSTEILPISTKGLSFFKLKYKLNAYSTTKRKVQDMDKILNNTESTDLLSLTPDEIMDVQGGDGSASFSILKMLVDALKKWGHQPLL